jgi:nitroreductase
MSGFLDTKYCGVAAFAVSIYALRLVQTLCFRSGKKGAASLYGAEESAFSKDLIPYVARQALETIPAGTKPNQVDFLCERLSEAEMSHRAEAYFRLHNQRRSVRFFSQDSFALDILLACVRSGGTAPSGAHQQPWHFSVISDPAIKAQVRELVEAEEQVNYERRMGEAWKQDLAPIFAGSALHKDGEIRKPYLTDAPYLVVVTEAVHGVDEVGKRFTHHYVKEGVGIACGLFISALTNIGLFTLTSTPLNAGSAICRLLERPANEKLFLLMPVGFPAPDATVPYRPELAERVPANCKAMAHPEHLRKHVDNICRVYA